MTFDRFRARITRGYVLVAVALIVAIGGATTVLAFLLFGRGMSDGITGAAARAAAAATSVHAPSFEARSRAIAARIRPDRFHIVAISSTGQVRSLDRRGDADGDRALASFVGRVVGLPHARVRIPGGILVIGPDIDRFASLLVWYWTIVLPIGVVCVLLAWLAGRRLTARAVGPLAAVTNALNVIAAGDDAPKPLRPGSDDLRELTDAYNDVVFRLRSADAQRAQAEGQLRRFIADAGHELRTPLTVIMGYLDALRRGIVAPGDAARETYATMLDESRRMRRTIEQLLALARLDRPQAVPLARIDLGNAVHAAARLLEPLAGGRLRVDVDPGIVAEADQSELTEAIKNVIDNALRYGGDGPVAVTLATEGDDAVITVADRGPGMSPEDRDNAFERFYRGSNASRTDGSGLGLSIAKRAAERANGSVSMTSAPGEGTHVELRLPLAGRET